MSKTLFQFGESLDGYSVPVLNEYGHTLEIRWPRPRYGQANDYLDGKHRVLHLRPAVPWTAAQVAAYQAEITRLKREIYREAGVPYESDTKDAEAAQRDLEHATLDNAQAVLDYGKNVLGLPPERLTPESTKSVVFTSPARLSMMLFGFKSA